MTKETKTGNKDAKAALFKRMKGRVMIAEAMAGTNNYYNGYNTSVRDAIAGISQEDEYRLAIAMNSLRDPRKTLDALSFAIRTTPDGSAYKDAARGILRKLWLHKRNLDEASRSPRGKDMIGNYIMAFTGVREAGAEDMFLALDSKRLIDGLGNIEQAVHAVFLLLPYYDRPEYVFHVMGDKRLANAIYEAMPDRLAPGQLKALDIGRLIRSGILRNVTSRVERYVMRACASSPEAYSFLEYLSRTLPPGTWDEAVLNAGKARNVGLCEKILEQLKANGADAARTLELMVKADYSTGFLKAIERKLKKGAAEYASKVDGLTLCGAAAWILDRNDVLAMMEEEWWAPGYEETILAAMVRKWERVIAGFKDKPGLRSAAMYIVVKRAPANPNMLNERQLRRIAEDDMLDTPLPGWMKDATFDEIDAWYEINKLGPCVERDALSRIFKGLVGSLRPETAGRRMLQYARGYQACMASRGPEKELTPEKEERVLSCLLEKDLYAWMAAMGLPLEPSRELAVTLLPYAREPGLFAEARSEADVRFILRNPDMCRKAGLKDAKLEFCETDSVVLKLKRQLALEKGFYEKYEEQAMKFFLESAEIASSYAENLPDADMEKFRLIVKAAICGKLREVKFHAGDLNGEIGFPVNAKMAEAWTEDMETRPKDIFGGTCVEDSTFNGIMSLGVLPVSTCMNYRNGVYRECLMSYFDANKKVIYRLDENGNKIARAVLRFTKAVDGRAVNAGRMRFVDVENTSGTVERDEYPVLFLERMYSGYQGHQREVLAMGIIKLAIEKAERMGVGLALASDYASTDVFLAGFGTKGISVYITKSKSSSQYLDSFGGKKTYGSGEDSYMHSVCLVRDTRGKRDTCKTRGTCGQQGICGPRTALEPAVA